MAVGPVFSLSQQFVSLGGYSTPYIPSPTIFTPQRVSEIVLNSSSSKYTESGGENGIGTVYVVPLGASSNETTNIPARPLFPNQKNLPLINEIVYTISLPSPDAQVELTADRLYYINPVNIWNHPHHNAIPFSPPGNNLPNSQQKDYQQVEAGSVRKITDQSTEINLGDTFIERTNIHPLLPFEGDIIYEGRWGQSIRFGSTVSGSSNNWSTSGTNGDPITIIRNGQGTQSNEGWINITENINTDNSSIYLTSTQKLPIEVSSLNYYSYSTAPTAPNEFTGNQIVLNSNRLLFNSNTDNILLSSAQSISLSAINSVNVDTDKFIIQSNEVYLGSKNATESVLLGDSTVDLLFTLLENLATLTSALSSQIGVPEGAPLEPTRTSAQLVNNTVNDLLLQLNDLKSKYVKTA